MSEFKITKPGRYVMRNGEVATVLAEHQGWWYGCNQAGAAWSWRANGRFAPDIREHIFDLVAPYVEPPSLVERLRQPCEDVPMTHCQALRREAADEIEKLRRWGTDQANVIDALAAERDELRTDVESLNQMLRDCGQGQGSIDAYAEQCERVEKLTALRECDADMIRGLRIERDAIGDDRTVLRELLIKAHNVLVENHHHAAKLSESTWIIDQIDASLKGTL